MRSILLRNVPLAVLLTLAAAALAYMAPLDRELLLRIYALVIGALALATLTAATAFAAKQRKSPFVEAMRTQPLAPSRPEALVRLERQVALSLENAADFHFRLRPALVEATDAALWRTHGVQLEQAEAYMSPELWSVVRPDLPPPADRRAPGPPLPRVETLLDEIARIGP